MLKFKKQGSALVCKNQDLHNEYEIRETEQVRYALRVNGEVIHVFDNLEYAKKVASLIEEDAWN